MNNSSFNDKLEASFKSHDTEEWLDIYFTRPIGLVFALFWNKLGVHPNAITILSIFLGIAAGCMFYFTDLWHNIAGIVLLMLANFCDSTDGQMARLSGKKTLTGRILDGFSGDVWFFAIYAALCLRMTHQNIPGTTLEWSWGIWALGALAGFVCHGSQSSLADYYRQIHLFFLKGKQESELDNYAQQRAIYESLPKSALMERAFYYNYAAYCHSQEKRTPAFQSLKRAIVARYGSADKIPTDVKEAFLAGSRPLMKYTNVLTFNVRAICIYATCLLNIPWLYLLIEIIVLTFIYIGMHRRHEKLCKQIENMLK